MFGSSELLGEEPLQFQIPAITLRINRKKKGGGGEQE